MTSTPSARFRERVRRIDAEFGAAIRAMYTIESDDVVHIDGIWSDLERRKGHASRYMRAMSAVADEEGVDLRCQVYFLRYDIYHDDNGGYEEHEVDHLDALNDQGLDNGELLEWYRRLGFELEDPDFSDPDENPYIVRRATAPLPSP